MAKTSPISKVRYLDRNSLISEQTIQRNYYRELISQYGILVSYFRHDSSEFEQPSSEFYDYTYGDQSTKSYFLSAPMVVYMEMLGDSYLLNQFGIESDGDSSIFIVQEDFTEQFRDIIGAPKFTNISADVSGQILCFSGLVSGDIVNSDISGFTSANFVFPTSGSVSAIYDQGNFIRFPKPFNEFIAKSESFNERIVNGTLSGNLDGNLDIFGNGIVSGNISGDIQYFVPNTDRFGPNWADGKTLGPQVGDFFRISFDDPLNREEYEITKVYDRDLQTDGLNIHLTRYLWKADCVRRDASFETVIGEDVSQDVEEPFTQDKQRESDLHEIVSDQDIFNYDTEIIDDIDNEFGEDSRAYGGYGDPNAGDDFILNQSLSAIP